MTPLKSSPHPHPHHSGRLLPPLTSPTFHPHHKLIGALFLSTPPISILICISPFPARGDVDSRFTRLALLPSTPPGSTPRQTHRVQTEVSPGNHRASQGTGQASSSYRRNAYRIKLRLVAVRRRCEAWPHAQASRGSAPYTALCW